MALREIGLEVLTEFFSSKYGQMAGCCEHGNEPTSYTGYRSFFYSVKKRCPP